MDIDNIDVHRQRMLEAIAEARATKARGTGKPFGSVIVRDGIIIARAANEIFSLKTITAHAEMTAISRASQYLGSGDLSECILYATGQPCPMCLAALHIAGIRTLYYANTYTQAQAIGFQAAPLLDSLCSIFNASGADEDVFRSTSLLTIIHLPMPEAIALYDN